MNAAVRFREPLARHTAWRTGGPCDVWVVAHDDAAVVEVLADAKAAGWPVTVVGGGSRVLVRDGGVDGIVLKLGEGFQRVEPGEDEVMVIGGAVSVAGALAVAATRGLAPPDAACCWAGSFGAVALEGTLDVERVWLARPSGVREVAAADLGARSKGVVLRAAVRLERVGEAEAERRLLRALGGRELPPGSWVRAGRGRVREVMRRAALDRVRLRRVAIPDSAPELLVNLGGGTAQDLQLLHRSALARVKRTRGVTLETNMSWTGSKA